ncbi:hypothetical protein CORC01_03120 [Colletotrichum orchidophilum]|uniref:NmrA-like domain-containing protein n=1 Tax=Colletotrichum orchidophilum TaxID=1209926 RepID=A0A1G4BJG0_9PEZI|nr:uncharacterized protein CORC01_03120 [Colletotrichum orchidophilum]OHF01630.1 hypothetical protein CORC01_03120 [Colletotrichum orchidophilum]
MVSIIAVAGGTGDLGRTIVEAILADGKFSVIILSRKADDDKEKEIGARILPVDYSSVDDILRVLEENNVHTIISALNISFSVEPELNLIAAADQANSTKRYVPSIWGAEFTSEQVHTSSDYCILFMKTNTYSPVSRDAEEMPIVKPKILVADALKKTNLEFTTWHPGYFADYYVCPPLKSHLKSIVMAVDVVNNKAAIPGSGNVPVAFTFTRDLAKFVAASLTLPMWETETYLVGDKLTWNQLVDLAEAAKGVKFDVTYDSVERRAGTNLFAKFGLMFERGVFDFKVDVSIAQEFPDIKLRSMKELLEEAYKLEA